MLSIYWNTFVGQQISQHTAISMSKSALVFCWFFWTEEFVLKNIFQFLYHVYFWNYNNTLWTNKQSLFQKRFSSFSTSNIFTWFTFHYLLFSMFLAILRTILRSVMNTARILKISVKNETPTPSPSKEYAVNLKIDFNLSVCLTCNPIILCVYYTSTLHSITKNK